MTHGLLVWGGGGHGKVVADLIRACGLQLVGFVDRDVAKRGVVVEPGGACVTMIQAELEELLKSQADLLGQASSVALGIGDNRVRLRWARRLDALLAPSLVHPRATVSPSAMVGAGSVVFAGGVLNSRARVGEAVICDTRAV